LAKAKPNHIKIPLGTAVYPSLHKLDTEGKFPTNKYKTDILLSPEDLAKFKADFKEKTKGLGLTKASKLPFKVNKDGDTLVRLKSKFMPVGFDAKNKKLPEGTEVGGGSEIRCLANIFQYDEGVTLQVLQYQVKTLKTWSAQSAFDVDDDGYTHEGTESAFGGEDEEGDTETDDLDI
jgi:hypothetical protein